MSIKIKLNTGKSQEDNSQGFCPRCENFSSRLSDMGICATCDSESEKRIIQPSEKSYIKAGKREHVGL